LTLIKKILQNAQEYPDYIILCDSMKPNGITYKELDIMSGKVYAYLKSMGIGKEDFVMLNLPRGIQPLIALVGVLKAGAAFVLVEDNYAPERIEYIRKDCSCKIQIDSETWEKILTVSPLEGAEETDEHDAAFAVYTSGTTGNPKGVLHEFGNLDRMVESIHMTTCDQLATQKDRFALVSPLNFIASLLITVYAFYYVSRMYVVPYNVVKNPMKIAFFIVKNQITGTFLTPSHIRKMKSKPPQLKFCIIGSEPANEVFLQDLIIHNFYLMSESGFAVTHFLIDRKYEATPVGNSEFGHEIFLLDEKGNPVQDGEEGEICFENKYVRGYLNLPELTAEAFRDGLYHTGDLAIKTEDNQFVIVGRLSDMVKINGNRVEPGEIEGVAKKVLGIDWAAVRIFDEGRQIFICVYYTASINVDFEETREEMAKYLPYYMLPSYFIHIDSVPIRPNGKMDRKALPKPDIKSYMAEYRAPTNETEKALCEAFQKVLDIEPVGIDDDFYLLGGDSLSSMDVLVESKLKNLSIADIFAGHTPARIANIYLEKQLSGDSESDDEKEEAARNETFLLTPFQTYMFDYQMYTPLSTMWNVNSLYRFDKSLLNIEKLAEAMNRTIKAHPAFATVFSFNEEGDLVQSYKPEILEPVRIEKLSEFEFDELKNGFVAPFKILNSRLYRAKLYETEKWGYMFFDVHHTLFDGTSSKILMQDIVKAYCDMPLETDYFYLTLKEHQSAIGTGDYERDKLYFEEKYKDKENYSRRPKIDFDSRENTLGRVFGEMQEYAPKIERIKRKYNITGNAFFSLVSMLAVAVYNKDPHVLISWTYNGRDDLKKFSTVGLLLCDLRLAIELSRSMPVKNLYEDVQNQILAGIEHYKYPYTMIGANVVKDDGLCFLYQEDLRDTSEEMKELKIEEVEIRHNKAASENLIDIEVLDGSDGLELMIEYNASCYKEKSMNDFRDLFLVITECLIDIYGDENANIHQLIKAVYKKYRMPSLLMGWLR